MSKRKPARDEARELEALNAPVEGEQGQSPAVRALLSEQFVHAPDAQALDVALALQQLVRGQSAILSNLDEQNRQLNQLRARMAAYDEAAQKWEQDRAKFLQETRDQADKVRLTGDRLASAQAKAGIEFQAAVTAARADAAVDRLQFDAAIRAMPKVIVRHSGIPTQIVEGGMVVTRLMPLTLRLRHLTFTLPPNEDVEVPQVVADRLAELTRSRQETAERKQALLIDPNRGARQDTEVFRDWNRINQKYNSPTDGISIAS